MHSLRLLLCSFGSAVPAVPAAFKNLSFQKENNNTTMMMMKQSLLIAVLASAANAFAPGPTTARTSALFSAVAVEETSARTWTEKVSRP